MHDLEGRNNADLRGREFGLVNYIYRFVCWIEPDGRAAQPQLYNLSCL